MPDRNEPRAIMPEDHHVETVFEVRVPYEMKGADRAALSTQCLHAAIRYATQDQGAIVVIGRKEIVPDA